jgi:hypothetical protein
VPTIILCSLAWAFYSDARNKGRSRVRSVLQAALFAIVLTVAILVLLPILTGLTRVG